MGLWCKKTWSVGPERHHQDKQMPSELQRKGAKGEGVFVLLCRCPCRKQGSWQVFSTTTVFAGIVTASSILSQETDNCRCGIRQALPRAAVEDTAIYLHFARQVPPSACPNVYHKAATAPGTAHSVSRQAQFSFAQHL